MKIDDIPKLTDSGKYCVTIEWKGLERWLLEGKEDAGLNLDPDFQRAHVWTLDQQIAFIEFSLSGGSTGKDIYFNCPDWLVSSESGSDIGFVLVDGKQRLKAILGFVRNKIPAFGTYLNDFDRPALLLKQNLFRLHVNQLQTQKEVLQWYIDFNRGGTVHTDEEINKVENMIKNLPDDEASRLK